MAQSSFENLLDVAAKATEPSFPPATSPRFGGVDPLGLRQVNFDLMDEVFPDLNNVARHIRPFTLVTWAWRRAARLADEKGWSKVKVETIRDFVDRIDVIYCWSQFLRDPHSDLPGRDVLNPLLTADNFTFSGKKWDKQRETREYSTALMAPINYGPGLRTLKWLERHHEHNDVMVPNAAAKEALDAFEKIIAERLVHPAFSTFGRVTVTTEQVSKWAKGWELENPTAKEQEFFRSVFCGPAAPRERQMGITLMLEAAKQISTDDEDEIRRAMCGVHKKHRLPETLDDTVKAWRRVQIRQLFRLALEALLYWIQVELDHRQRSIDSLVESFIMQTPSRPVGGHSLQWLGIDKPLVIDPVLLIRGIEAGFDDPPNELPEAIVSGLAGALADTLESGPVEEAEDRLPLRRARREANAWSNYPPEAFLKHVFENWVLAQHVYWSVGRGLADARARQPRTLLRMKVGLEEGGWGMTPGAAPGNPPEPTRDRLGTAISLGKECNLFLS